MEARCGMTLHGTDVELDKWRSDSDVRTSTRATAVASSLTSDSISRIVGAQPIHHMDETAEDVRCISPDHHRSASWNIFSVRWIFKFGLSVAVRAP